MSVIARFMLLLSLSCGALNSASANLLSLADAEQSALAGSPLLAEIQARLEAAQEVPEQLGALPDPVLTLALLSVPTDGYSLDQEAMTQLQVGFSQAIPWPSQRRLSRSTAEQQVKATAAELQEARNALRRDIHLSWWSLHFIDRSLTVVEDNLQQLRQFNQIAQSRYRVGQGLQQDALQAQLQLSAQLEQRLLLQGRRRTVEAQLNALLARPESGPLALAEVVAVAGIELPALERLLATALQKRPLLAQKQRLVDAARDRQALARTGLLPGLTLGAAYGYRQDAPNGSSRADLVSINLGIKLPLYAGAKQQRQIGQRGADLIGFQAGLRAAQLQVRSAVVQASSNYQQAQQQASLLEQGMIPQSKQTLASMLSGYQVGKVDFSALIQAQLMVNRLQLQYWKAISEGQMALASLNFAVGEAIVAAAAAPSQINLSKGSSYE